MRLTNNMRDTITKAALEHRFADAIKFHLAQRQMFAADLYAVDMGNEAEVVIGVSKRWYETSDTFKIEHPDFQEFWGYRCGTDHIGDADDKEDCEFALPEGRAFPHQNYEFVIHKKHPMYQAARELAKAGQTLRKERDKVKSELAALLRTFNTTTKLFEAWPEGERFLNPPTPAVEKGKALVPAQLAARINAMLGLS